LNHFENLKTRPDYDGFVTIDEGVAWAKDRPNTVGNNDPNDALYLDASQLNFGSLSVDNIPLSVGQTGNVNLFDHVNWFNSESRATTYALGNTQMHLVNDKTGNVKLFQDFYDWDYHNYPQTRRTSGQLPESKRDRLIYMERRRSGVNDTHGFKVHIYGSGTIKTN